MNRGRDAQSNCASRPLALLEQLLLVHLYKGEDVDVGDLGDGLARI